MMQKRFEEVAKEEEDKKLQPQQDAMRVLPPITMATTMSIDVAIVTSITFHLCVRWNMYKMGLNKLVLVVTNH
jgi:hypothetical protein